MLSATAPVPRRDFAPMLLTLAKALPPDAHRYGFEVKWDGFRAVVHAGPGQVRVSSRNHTDLTALCPGLQALGGQLGGRSAVFDGELVCLDENAKPSFSRLQACLRSRWTRLPYPAMFVAFDVVEVDGAPVVARPLTDRRRLLAELLPASTPSWTVSPLYEGNGVELFVSTKLLGLEGIVAKRLDSKYTPGRRSSAWLKLKHHTRREGKW